MILLPVDVSLSSGSVPMRPTMVMRARRLGPVVVKVRASVAGRIVALRRAGLRRKDIVMGCRSGVCLMRFVVTVLPFE